MYVGGVSLSYGLRISGSNCHWIAVSPSALAKANGISRSSTKSRLPTAHDYRALPSSPLNNIDRAELTRNYSRSLPICVAQL
ncbi:hypothetical protein WA026_004400 [Henosepilachna vigintioctopunctata]|uniref:Uncharacterized protein n=1 Tax=Henosepilachna vigintioctopunctata TaxID=420089 RepID=A0AAW1V7Y2_9CUCU